MEINNTTPWLLVAGEESESIEASLRQRVSKRVKEGHLSWDDVYYVSHLKTGLTKEPLNLSNEHLEKLRRLCELSEVDLRIHNLSSHRKILGPLIVALKKLCLPILRVLLKDTLRKQRDFNASVVSLLIELTDRVSVHGGKN